MVPVRNGASSLPALLSSLAAQDLEAERYEVVVVDNASTDETAEIARAHDVTVVFEGRPNRSRARNAGASRATADTFAFIDADCTATPQWLSELLACRGSAPLVAGTVRMKTRERPNALERFDAGWRFRQEAGLQEGWAATANLLVERFAFEAVNGFDDSYSHIGEDVDFCLRAGRAGHGIAFCPSAVVHHEAEKGLVPVVKRSFLHGYSASQLLRRLGTGHDAWRNAAVALSPRAALNAHGIAVEGSPQRERALHSALAMVSYASRVVGSAWASLRGAR